MGVVYVPYGTVRVSRRWRRVLRHADKDGVNFHVNSGHRTIREQWQLFRQNMQFVGGHWIQKPGRPLTAFPSCTAPHIRCGKANHALDVDTTKGGETRLQIWVERHGVDWMNTVSTEAWHGEVSWRGLRKLDRMLRKGRN